MPLVPHRLLRGIIVGKTTTFSPQPRLVPTKDPKLTTSTPTQHLGLVRWFRSYDHQIDMPLWGVGHRPVRKAPPGAVPSHGHRRRMPRLCGYSSAWHWAGAMWWLPAAQHTKAPWKAIVQSGRMPLFGRRWSATSQIPPCSTSHWAVAGPAPRLSGTILLVMYTPQNTCSFHLAGPAPERTALKRPNCYITKAFVSSRV